MPNGLSSLQDQVAFRVLFADLPGSPQQGQLIRIGSAVRKDRNANQRPECTGAMLRMFFGARQFEQARGERGLGPIAEGSYARFMDGRTGIGDGRFEHLKDRRAADPAQRGQQSQSLLFVQALHGGQCRRRPLIQILHTGTDLHHRLLGRFTFFTRFRFKHALQHARQVIGGSKLPERDHGRFPHAGLIRIRGREHIGNCIERTALAEYLQ